MLFSNPSVAAVMTHFECAWESLRPAPQVHVDFGNGVKLRRTILGNVATWLCFEDGTTYDVLPGVMTPDAFIQALKTGLRDHRTMTEVPRARRAGMVRSNHRLRGRLPSLVRPLPSLAARPAGRIAGQIAGQPAGRAAGHAITPAPFGRADLLKRVVESPLKRLARRPERPLELDSSYNHAIRKPQVHRLFAVRTELAPPAALQAELFRDVLHVPLDDPFLGLAPHGLGGELGRTIPGTTRSSTHTSDVRHR